MIGPTAVSIGAALLSSMALLLLCCRPHACADFATQWEKRCSGMELNKLLTLLLKEAESWKAGREHFIGGSPAAGGRPREPLVEKTTENAMTLQHPIYKHYLMPGKHKAGYTANNGFTTHGPNQPQKVFWANPTNGQWG